MSQIFIFINTNKESASCEIIGLSQSVIKPRVPGDYVNATTIFNAVEKNITNWKKKKETIALFKNIKEPTKTYGRDFFVHKELLSNITDWCYESIINKTNSKRKLKQKVETFNEILERIKNASYITLRNHDNCIITKDLLSIIYKFLYDADEGVLITKTRALKEYNLKLKDLLTLPFKEVQNPHYKCAAPMKLFDKSQVRKLSETTDNKRTKRTKHKSS